MSTMNVTLEQVRVAHVEYDEAMDVLRTAVEMGHRHQAAHWLLDHHPRLVLRMGLWHVWTYPGNAPLFAHIPEGCQHPTPEWFAEPICQRLHELDDRWGLCFHCVVRLITKEAQR